MGTSRQKANRVGRAVLALLGVIVAIPFVSEPATVGAEAGEVLVGFVRSGNDADGEVLGRVYTTHPGYPGGVTLTVTLEWLGGCSLRGVWMGAFGRPGEYAEAQSWSPTTGGDVTAVGGTAVVQWVAKDATDPTKVPPAVDLPPGRYTATFANPTKNNGPRIELTTGRTPDGLCGDLGVFKYDGEAPVAAFDAVASSSNPREVQFTNRSTDPDGEQLTYSWSFGDGPSSTSTEKDPVHVYAASGSYDVTLTALDPRGKQASVTKTVEIEPLTGSWFRVDGLSIIDAGDPTPIRLRIANGSGTPLTNVTVANPRVTFADGGGRASLVQTGDGPTGTLTASGAGAVDFVDYEVTGSRAGPVTLVADLSARTPEGATLTAMVERTYTVRAGAVVVTLTPDADPVELEVEGPAPGGRPVDRAYIPEVIGVAVTATNESGAEVDQVRMPDDLSFLSLDGYVGPGRLAVVGGPCASASACRPWSDGGLDDVDATYGPLDPAEAATAHYLVEVRRPGRWEGLAVVTWTQSSADKTASGRGDLLAVGPPGDLAASFSYETDDTFGPGRPIDLTSKDGRLEGEIFAGDEITYEGTNWEPSGLPIDVTLNGDEVTEHPAAEAFTGEATIPEPEARPASDPLACSAELTADQGASTSVTIKGEPMATVLRTVGSFRHTDDSQVAIGDALCTGSPAAPAGGDGLLVAEAIHSQTETEREIDWDGWWVHSVAGGQDLEFRGGLATNLLEQRTGGRRELAGRERPIPVALQPGRTTIRNAKVGTAFSSTAAKGPRLLRTANGGLAWNVMVGNDVVIDGLEFLQGDHPCQGAAPPWDAIPLVETDGVVYLSGRLSGAGQITGRVVWMDGVAGSLDPCATNEGDLALSVRSDAVIIGPVPGATWMQGPGAPGATEVEVANNESIPVGSRVIVGPGTGSAEVVTVKAHGSLIFDRPLRYAHPAGTLIIDADDPPTDYPGMAELLAGTETEPTTTLGTTTTTTVAATTAPLPKTTTVDPTASPGGTLPRTGSSTSGQVLAGLAFVVLGTMCVIWSRRRRTTAA